MRKKVKSLWGPFVKKKLRIINMIFLLFYRGKIKEKYNNHIMTSYLHVKL